jgi:hypothetical protein
MSIMAFAFGAEDVALTNVGEEDDTFGSSAELLDPEDNRSKSSKTLSQRHLRAEVTVLWRTLQVEFRGPTISAGVIQAALSSSFMTARAMAKNSMTPAAKFIQTECLEQTPHLNCVLSGPWREKEP